MNCRRLTETADKAITKKNKTLVLSSTKITVSDDVDEEGTEKVLIFPSTSTVPYSKESSASKKAQHKIPIETKELIEKLSNKFELERSAVKTLSKVVPLIADKKNAWEFTQLVPKNENNTRLKVHKTIT